MTKTIKRQMEMQIRLNRYTTEYLTLEREKEAYYVAHVRDISRTAIVTMYLMQSNIDCLIKQICTLTGRLIRDDVDIDNEVAIELYNYYEPRIKRGLSDLL